MDPDHVFAGIALALWGSVAAVSLTVIALVGIAVFRAVVNVVSQEKLSAGVGDDVLAAKQPLGTGPVDVLANV